MLGIDENKKVEVYFNLHKKCWSIRQSGRPVVHSDFIEIKDPQFVVQQGGNARAVSYTHLTLPTTPYV